MKLKKINISFLICVICIALVNMKNIKINAVDKENILSINALFYKDTNEEYSLFISDDCEIKMNFNGAMVENAVISICIKDDNGNTVYSNEIDEYEEYSSAIKLKAGNYALVLCAKYNNSFFEMDIYADYYPCKNHPELKINKKNVSLFVGQKQTIKIISNPKDSEYNVKWSSSNKRVATVSKEGKITAKNKGTTTITAKIGEKTFQCKVLVKKKQPTYSQMVKKAKKYKKGIVKFKHIDVGYHCRLYENLLLWKGEYRDGLRFYIFTCMPHIDIKKNKNKVNISLYLSGDYAEVSFSDYMPDFSKLKLYTKNRKNTFELDAYSGTSRMDSDGIYVNKYKWKVKLSTNNKLNKEKVKKLMNMLKQKSEIKVKLQDDVNLEYICAKTYKTTGRRWMKIFNAYNDLLKLY